MLHGDPRHSHRAHGQLPERPRVAWSFRADGPVEGQIVASPDGATVYLSTLAGTLWALDRAGTVRFRVSLGGRAYGTPCVGPDGMIYVGVDGGAFLAVDPSGQVVWKLETNGDADTAAVLLPDGTVVFAAGSRVYGVRAGGVVGFRFQAKGKVFTAPALTERKDHELRLVVGSQDDHVYALTLRGELAWSTDLGSDVDGAAAIGDQGEIYVGTDGGDVVRLDDEGNVRWRVATGGFVRGTLSVARNGDVLAGVYGAAPHLVRISEGGATLGTFPTPPSGTPETGVHGGALEDDDGALAFGTQEGSVRVIGPDGRARWSYEMNAEVDAPLSLLDDGCLIAADYDGNVVALGP